MKKILLLVSSILALNTAKAQCPPNNPKKLMASAFHASVLITNTGSVRYWGQDASQSLTAGVSTNVLSPLTLTGYTGTPVSVAASSAGVREPSLFLHTTTNIYGWGYSNSTIAGGTGGDIALSTIALPTGVTIDQVSFIESSLGGLALITNSGAVYIKQGGNIGSNTALVYGDGTTGTTLDLVWHRVKTGALASDTLTGVVELSYGGRGIMVLTGTGNLYVWGDNVLLGDGTAAADRNYATLMTKPSGVTVAKVEMVTKVTYDGAGGTQTATQFVLGTDGKMYGVGEGNRGVLGQGNETDATNWVTVKGPGLVGDLSGIIQMGSNNPLVWTGAHYNAGALTSAGKLYLWGDNARRMVGTDTLFNVDSAFYTVPRVPPNFSFNNSALGYFEMGGHTTAAFQAGSSKFCYIGHKVNGSMGDGIDGDQERWSFDCINTPEEYICPPSPIVGCPLPSANNLFASAVHSTLVINGSPLVTYWGEAASSAEPGVNTPAQRTLFEYTGTPVGVAASGVAVSPSAQATQMWVQTTDGIWGWGYSANTIFANRAGASPFASLPLPGGVTAAQISFIRSARGGIALVTTTGNVWVRAGASSACSPLVYGDATASLDVAGSTTWHQVQTAPGTPLTGVVELSFGGTSAIAITATQAYVWGANTYLGDATGASNRNRASLMTLPAGVTPRTAEIIQSGAFESAQFILGRNNRVYCLGRNANGVLGKGLATTAVLTSWDSLTLSGIRKISSNNPFANNVYSIGAITILGDVYLWGANDNNRIGFTSTADVTTPTLATTIASGNAASLEIGGEHTIIFAKSSSRFYFAGRSTGGSRADGTADGVSTNFTLAGTVVNCTNTAFDISGNLYQDNNGLTDNLVNGTAISSIATVAMHANLLDEGGYVIATSPIVAGAYSFTSLPYGNYFVQVSPTVGTVFSLAPTTKIPAGFVYGGDQTGIVASVGIDTIADGRQAVALSANRTNVNFGITPIPPVANNITATRMNSSNVATAIPSLQASNPSGVAISSYRVLSLPPASEGVLYYCATAPTVCAIGSLTAVSTSSSLTAAQAKGLYFDPAQTFTGNSTFTYNATDANGLLSNTANYSIPVFNNPPITMDVTVLAMKNTNGPTDLPSLIAADADGSVSNYTVSSIPSSTQGVLSYCSNGTEPCTGVVTTISGSTVLTAAQMATLKLDPDPAFTGTYTFDYIATDNNGNTSNTSKFNVPVIAPPTSSIPGNLPPVATNIVAQNINNTAGATPIPNLMGTDPDGTINNYTIGATVPNPLTQGTLSYCVTPPATGCGTAVLANQTLTPAQAATLSFDPVASFIGTASFTYTATDNYGTPLTSAPATYQIPIVNQPPVANPDRVAPIANTLVTPTRLPPLSGNDYDGTVDSFTITTIPPSTSGTLQYCVTGSMPGCTLGTIATGAAPITLTPAQAATLNFIPNSNFTGDYVFNFTTKDNNGLVSVSAPFTIPVVAAAVTVGQPPLAFSFNAPAINNTASATLLTGALTGTDPDGTISSYTVRSITPANEGSLTYCTAPGTCGVAVTVGLVLTPAQALTVSFTPNANFVGTSTFTYTDNDNDGNLSNTATVTIPVTNNPPVAKNITNSPMAKNASATSINPLASTDADGTIVSYKILTIPTADEGVLRVCTTAPSTGCSVVTAGQALTPTQITQLAFTPNPSGTSPVVTFLYSTLDNSGNSSNIAAASMSLFDPLILPPIANNITAPALNNSLGRTPIPSLQASSPSGTAISTFNVLTLPAASEGVLYYCTTAPAVCALGSLTAVSTSTPLTLAQAKSLYFDPAATFTGNSSYTYNAVDANGLLSNTANYSIPVVNEPPVTLNVVTTRLIDSTSLFYMPELIGADKDGTVDSFTLTNIPDSTGATLYYCTTGVPPLCTGGSLTPIRSGSPLVLSAAQAKTIQVDPNAGFSGDFVFNYTAKDNNNNISNISTYTIPIGPNSWSSDYGNQPPVATNITSQNINNSLGVTPIPNLLGTDPDGSVVSYQIGTTIPNALTEGILYYCTAGSAPLCTGGSLTAVSVGMSLTPSQAATLSFDPLPSFIGVANFTYTATDNNGVPLTSVPATYKIPVFNVRPVANPDRVAPIANTLTTPTLLSPLTGSDFDGNVVTYNITSVPSASQGTLKYCVGPAACTPATLTTISGALSGLTPAQVATLNFIPNGGFTGDYLFNFTTTDNNGLVSLPAIFTVPVVAFDVTPGEPPIAFSYNNVPINSASTALLTTALTGTDPDGTITSYTVSSIPPVNEGELTYCVTPGAGCVTSSLPINTVLTPAQAATIVFTPNSNFRGTTTFTYTNLDNDGNLSNTATVTIPVVNNPPVAQNSNNASISRFSPATALNSLVSSDADGSVVSYRILTLPSSEQGVLSYCTSAPTVGCNPVAVGQVLTPTQAANLAFTPNDWNHSPIISFLFAATDNSGLISNVAAVNIPMFDATPLPIKLLEFDAKKLSNSSSLIEWRTAAEKSVGEYQLEHSINGQMWSIINTQKAKNDGSITNSYNYVHNNLTSGKQFYRLKMIDMDNSYNYSPTRILVMNQNNGSNIYIYPNPANTNLNIDLTEIDANIDFQMLDAMGRVVLHGPLQCKTINRLDVNSLVSGVYLIKVITDSNTTTHQVQIIK